MARGNRIVISPDPKGHRLEGVVGAGLTIYPGMCLQKDYSVALQGGRHTYKIYDADADGGRPKSEIFIAEEDLRQGHTASDPYSAGERLFGYCPLPGDEINLLLLNISGTADDHAIGEMLIIDDTTGKFIATTGSPETEVAVLQEAVTDPTTDTLAWCQWTGY